MQTYILILFILSIYIRRGIKIFILIRYGILLKNKIENYI